MDKRKYEIIGSGITKRRRYEQEPVPLHQAARSWIDWLNREPGEVSKNSWKGQSGWIAAVSDRLAEIEAGAPDYKVDPEGALAFHKANFRERQDEGWYLLELKIGAQSVERLIEAKLAGSAASEALRIGELLAEWRLKFLWEEHAVKGQRTQRERRDAGLATRKGSDAERLARWLQYRTAGHGYTDADYLTAVDLEVSEATIRGVRTREGYKKGADASD